MATANKKLKVGDTGREFQTRRTGQFFFVHFKQADLLLNFGPQSNLLIVMTLHSKRLDTPSLKYQPAPGECRYDQKHVKQGRNVLCSNMGVGRGCLDPPGFWNYWQKKGCFSNFEGVKTKCQHFWPRLEKISGKSHTAPPPWKKSFRRPCVPVQRPWTVMTKLARNEVDG